MQMKDRLNSLITAYMQCVPTSSLPNATKIQADLSTLGHAFSLPPNAIYSSNRPADFGKYGYQLSFGVRFTADARRLVSITATFDIECGSDAMLLLFSPTDLGWQEMLRWQSPPYKGINVAFESFDYAISPPAADGHWYVLVKSTTPWCTSAWRGLHYYVLRPSQDSPSPIVLFSGSHSTYIGWDDSGTLTASATDFEIRFHAESIDPMNVLDRLFIYHFRMTERGLTRIQPVANNPRDFVDEWIVSPWAEASKWTSPAERQQLSNTHAELQALLKAETTSNSNLYEFRSALRCSDSADHYQIGLADPNGQLWYFQVEADGIDTMRAIGYSTDSRCGGQDLLQEMGFVVSPTHLLQGNVMEAGENWCRRRESNPHGLAANGF